jgi:hypothetical protein
LLLERFRSVDGYQRHQKRSREAQEESSFFHYQS